MEYWFCGVVLFVLISAGLPIRGHTASEISTTDGDKSNPVTSFKSTTLNTQASPRTPSHNGQCPEFSHCTLELTELRSAVAQELWEDACRIMTPLFECQKKAIEYCKEGHIIAGASLSRLENIYIHTSIKMHSFCDKANQNNSDEEAKTVRCSEYRQCWETRDRFVYAVQTNQRHQACRYVTPIYDCTSAALADCKSKGTLPQETVKVMEKYNLQAKALMEKHCSYSDEANQETQPYRDFESERTKVTTSVQDSLRSATASTKIRRPSTNPTAVSSHSTTDDFRICNTKSTSHDKLDIATHTTRNGAGNSHGTFVGGPVDKQSRPLRKTQVQDTNSGCIPLRSWLTEPATVTCICLYLLYCVVKRNFIPL